MTKSTPPSSGDSTAESPPPAARTLREAALNEARRGLILEAARSAFLDLGLDGASLREIAKRAGYTPGAIYSYFDSREAIYAALLGESLERLKQSVDGATATHAPDARSGASDLLRARATAFFTFYRDHPQDMDLGFYLFNGARPRGLTPELNQQLNGQLLATLQPMQDTLAALGLPLIEAEAEVTALFAHAVGLLMLNNTGRIRLFRQDAQALFERYLDALLTRLSCPGR